MSHILGNFGILLAVLAGAFMTQSSLSQTQSSITLDALAKDAKVALILQLAGAALTYLLQVFLAQWMGKTEYGIYAYVISWSIFLAILAGLGLPRAVLRFVSQYKVQQDWGRLHGIVRSSYFVTVFFSFLVCCCATKIILLLSHDHSFVYSTPLLVGIWMVLLQALVELQSDTARALDDVTLAYAPSKVVWPILVLGGGFLLWETNDSLTSVPMISVSTLMLLTVVVFQSGLLWRKFNAKVDPAESVYSHREWLGVALPMLLQRSFVIILEQTDVVMIGTILGPAEAGIYTAAVNTSLWVTFVLLSVNLVAAPAFTTLHTQGDIQGLQEIVSTVALWIFWPTLAIASFLIIFAQPVLSLYGSAFVTATWQLKILVLGQVVNGLCGSVSILLVMTGHQNKSVQVFGCTALINVVGNAIAIPVLGSVGAAMTTSLCMVVANIWLYVLVVRNIGVHPSIFSSFSSKV